MDKKEKRITSALCDIYMEDGSVVMKMEMPGVSKENLDIKVDGDLLSIYGKKNISAYPGDYRVKEIKDCDYYHEFSLDDTIDRNKIDAAIVNGIVEITMGIKESEKPRKIKVNVK